jgi:hypothetical protein
MKIFYPCVEENYYSVSSREFLKFLNISSISIMTSCKRRALVQEKGKSCPSRVIETMADMTIPIKLTGEHPLTADAGAVEDFHWEIRKQVFYLPSNKVEAS